MNLQTLLLQLEAEDPITEELLYYWEKTGCDGFDAVYTLVMNGDAKPTTTAKSLYVLVRLLRQTCLAQDRRDTLFALAMGLCYDEAAQVRIAAAHVVIMLSRTAEFGPKFTPTAFNPSEVLTHLESVLQSGTQDEELEESIKRYMGISNETLNDNHR
jgi:hypothetical protein